MGDGDFDFLVGEALLQVVAQALGGHAQRVAVHAVGARAHDAAQAACAKLQGAVEGVGQRIVLAGGLELLYFGLGISVVSRREPGRDALLNVGGEGHGKKEKRGCRGQKRP